MVICLFSKGTGDIRWNVVFTIEANFKTMNQTYKFSYYNFIVPVEEENVVLLYNSLMGGLYAVPKADYDILHTFMDNKMVSLSSIPEQLKSTFLKLIDARYIITSDVNEFEVYKLNYEHRRETITENGRFAVTITPSLNCNLACRYCFQTGLKPGC